MPLLAWLLMSALLVSPRRSELALAEQSLLSAEREELTAQVEADREERAVARLQRTVETLLSDAERIRTADTSVMLQLAKPDEYATKPWILPRQGAERTGPEVIYTGPEHKGNARNPAGRRVGIPGLRI